jgi:hypothetical protein
VRQGRRTGFQWNAADPRLLRALGMDGQAAPPDAQTQAATLRLLAAEPFSAAQCLVGLFRTEPGAQVAYDETAATVLTPPPGAGDYRRVDAPDGDAAAPGALTGGDAPLHGPRRSRPPADVEHGGPHPRADTHHRDARARAAGRRPDAAGGRPATAAAQDQVATATSDSTTAARTHHDQRHHCGTQTHHHGRGVALGLGDAVGATVGVGVAVGAGVAVGEGAGVAAANVAV